MKALVVYDSVFGNTERVAQALGRAMGLEDTGVLRAGSVAAEQLAGVELLIVGSPTRGFRPTPATTAFLKGIAAGGLKGTKVAAFDTRISVQDAGSGFLRFMVRLFGYAAQPIANRLVRKGGELVAAPEGFIVVGSEGPLKEGELARAAEWARQILKACG